MSALAFTFAGGVALTGFVLARRGIVRHPEDVVNDLSMYRNKQPVNFDAHDLGVEKKSKNQNRSEMILIPSLLSSTILLMLACSTTDVTLEQVLSLMVIGAGAGVIVVRRRTSTRARRLQQQISFFLPVVMERVVMGVQAGLDIVPALKAAAQHDSTQPLDPVSAMIQNALRLAENGIPLDQVLKSISSPVDSSALRHAFLHLGLAYRDGGELSAPLRELSDATQLHYQESVEEEIAKLPARATLPLIIIFAGLLVSFITTPMLQVLKLSDKTSLSSKGATQ